MLGYEKTGGPTGKRREPCYSYSVMKLCIFVGINVGGCLGWWLGEYVGVMTAFLASGVGSLVGVYAGWWFAREYLG